MSNPQFIIEFSEHLPKSKISSILSGVAAYGNILQGQSTFIFKAEVFRNSKVDLLRERLVEWERYGFLRWQLEK